MDKERLTSELDKACEGCDVALLVTEADEYRQANLIALRFLHNEEGLPGVYVAVNKPYQTLMDTFQEEGIDTEDIFFIDAISKEVGGDKGAEENVVFLDSPANLTDMSIVISQINEKIPEEKFLFLDSLSALTIYNKTNTVSEFSHHLTGKMQQWNVTGVIISMHEDIEDEVISKVRQFCDRVIEV